MKKFIKNISLITLFMCNFAFAGLEDIPSKTYITGTCEAISNAYTMLRFQNPKIKNPIARTFDVRETEPGDYLRKVHYRVYFQYEVQESSDRLVRVSGYDAYSNECGHLGTIVNDRVPVIRE